MVVTVDLSGVDSAKVVVHGSPLIETMATLHMLTEREHHFDQRSVIQAAHEALPPALMSDVQLFAPLWSRLRCRLFFPSRGNGLPRRWDEQLAAIAQLDERDFVSLAAEGVLGLGRRADHDALLCRPESFLTMCRSRSSDRADLARRLLDDPAAFRARFLSMLDGVWDSFARQDWAQLAPAIHDAAARTRTALRADPARAVADLSETAKIVGDRRIAFDKLDLLAIAVGNADLYLVASVRHSPHLTIKSIADHTVAIVYPIAHASQQLSLRSVQQRLEAVSSPFRMMLLRHLLAEPQTTSELAMRLDVDASQVSRALTLLRRAGLVVSERANGTLLHVADAAMLRRLGLDVVHTILR